MKKFYLLSLLFCSCISAFGQTTRYIYATGLPGSYITGNSSTTVRTDDVIDLVPFMQRGYAVFNLASGLPSGAVITTVDVGFNIEATTGMGMPGNTLRGYNGDLSTFTAPSSLYSLMGSATTYNSTTWLGAPGNDVLPSNPTFVTFIQNAFNGGTATGHASMIWAAGGLSYTITGESGTETTTGTHAPYLKVGYNCAGLTVTTNATPSPVCANTPFTLTSSSSTGVSYSWSGPGGYTSTSQNPPAIPGLSTFGVYTLVVTNAAGCDATTLVNVFVTPGPYTDMYVLNYSAFCTGDFSQLSGVVPFSTTYTYQWYNNGAEITGATDAEYDAPASGYYKVLVTDQSTGCADSAATPTHVVLLDTEVPTNPMGTFHLCPGNSTAFTIDPSYLTSDITLQWQRNNVDIAGANSASYNTSLGGVYKCILSTPVSTCFDSTTKDTVITNGSPVPVVSIAGGMLTTSNTYTAYQWYLNTVAISGATNNSVVPASNGSYRVRVSDGSACAGYSASFPYYTTGVGQFNKSDISIYPNPVNTVLHIESPLAVKAIITGLEGRVQMVQADAKDMDISVLANGIYIISLYDAAGERVAVQEFVKQ